MHRSTSPITLPLFRVEHATSGGSSGLFIERRGNCYLCSAVHAPLDHAGLPFHSFLPPRNHAHIAYARTCIQVDQYTHLRPAGDYATAWSARNGKRHGRRSGGHHHVALARRARQCRHRLFRPSAGDASRKHLHLAFRGSLQPLSQRKNSPLRERLTFSSTLVLPSGGARAAATTPSSAAPSYRTPFTNFSGFDKLPPAPTAITATVGWNL